MSSQHSGKDIHEQMHIHLVS